MAIILTERSAALSITKVYQERLMKSAELVAKKELVSLSTAIDSAAVKGQDSLTFKLSASITKLSTQYKAVALQIIKNDIMSAGYDAQILEDRTGVVGFEISWAEEEEPEEEEVEDSSSISAVMAENANAYVKLAADMDVSTPITVEEGQKLTVNLNSNDVSSNVASGQALFAVNGGELVLNGSVGSDIVSAQRLVVVSNGGKATINGGNYTTSSAGQVFSAIGEGSELIINDGVINSQECGAMAFDGATVHINGGTFNTVDNFAIGTNGTNGRGKNTITIDNCVINANITSNGYEAVGIYAANDDTIIVGPNVKINVINGCGICQRAGQLTVKSGTEINVTTTKDADFTGKVGDAAGMMTQSGIIYDERANYPGKPGMALVVEDGVKITAVKHSIEILSNEAEPNVQIGQGTYDPAYPEPTPDPEPEQEPAA